MVNWSLVPTVRGVLSAAATLGLLFVAGCQAPNPVDVDGTFVSSPALAARSPAVVSVLPVEIAPAAASAGPGSIERHRTFLRQELRRQLSERLYAATTEQWVDASLRGAGASVSGTGGSADSVLTPANLERLAAASRDDAVFALRVDEWDETTLLADRKVKFRFQAALVAKDGTQLWSGDLAGRVKSGGISAAPRGRDAASRSCVEMAVRQLLLRLPDRTVR